MLTPKGGIEAFAQDLPLEERKTMVSTQAATQGSIPGTPITNAAWHSKPSWFVIASSDRTIAPEQERSTAASMGAKTLTLPTSHVPMLSKPKEVAEFIAEVCRKLK